jgi:hypothetical protein
LGRGAYDSSELPKITVQGIQHFRNRPLKAAGKATSASAFFDHRQEHFFAFHFRQLIFLIFLL